MTQAKLNDLLLGLPHGLAQQIAGYVGAVRDKLPDIFQEAGVSQTDALNDAVLLVATLRKLSGIVATAFWTSDNCLEELSQSQISSFRIGGTTYERSSPDMDRLCQLHAELEDFLSQQGMTELLTMQYQDIVRTLAHE